MRLLYVTSGKGFPFSPIDSSIIKHLRSMVRELEIAQASDAISEISEKVKPDFVFVFDGCTPSLSKLTVFDPCIFQQQFGLRMIHTIPM